MEDQDPSLEEVEVKVDAQTHLVQKEVPETFWELYSKLGDCYRTDMARLTQSGEGPAQSSILDSASEYVGGLKSPIFFSGASDDAVAKSQGLRLQQARCEPDGARILPPAPEAPSLYESSHHSQGAQDAHFDLRACWLDRAGTNPQKTELQRRRMSLTSADVCRESVAQLMASQPRFLVFSPHESFRRAWDVLFAGFVVLELILNPLHAFDNAWSLERIARSSWNALELILHVFWNLDLLVTMRTAVFCSGYLDFRQGAILKSYAKGWLTFDLILAENMTVLSKAIPGSLTIFTWPPPNISHTSCVCIGAPCWGSQASLKLVFFVADFSKQKLTAPPFLRTLSFKCYREKLLNSADPTTCRNNASHRQPRTYVVVGWAGNWLAV